MKIQSVLGLVAAAGMASAASAQSFFTSTGISATFTLSWQEDPGGWAAQGSGTSFIPATPAFPHNDNGVLDPGEHALIRANLAYTGQGGSANFGPAIGAFTSGTIIGLGAAYFDITSAAGDASGLYNNGTTAPTSTSIGGNSPNSGTTHYGVRGGLRVGGFAANGQPAANGFVNIGPGQLPSDPGSANSLSPISNLVRLGWAPNSYAQRTQTFSLAAALGAGATAVGLYCDFDGSIGGTVFIPLNQISFASVNIPIAPAPASLALLGLGGLVAGRRRR